MSAATRRDPDLIALGGKLLRARLGRGQEREPLALAARVAPDRLAAIEAGRSAPTVAELRRLADALGGLTLTWQDLQRAAARRREG